MRSSHVYYYFEIAKRIAYSSKFKLSVIDIGYWDWYSSSNKKAWLSECTVLDSFRVHSTDVRKSIKKTNTDTGGPTCIL